jgi:hypothetical protein
MKNRDRSLLTASSPVASLPLAATNFEQILVLVTMLLVSIAGFAQQTPQTAPATDAQASAQTSPATDKAGAEPPVPETSLPENASLANTSVTIPDGTRIALVLTHSIQTRYIRRGDDIYAQITAPITAGNEVVIPPGTFVQGKVDKLARNGSRGELYLQSMEAIFPDGYVVPISGPVTLETDSGYALKDPGPGRVVGAFALPAAGAGLGALIGHSVASSQNTTITSTLPPGCTGPPPGCLSSSLTTPPDKGKGTAIGAAVGGIIGAVASLLLLTSSHNFFLDVGSPVEMMLQQPLSLPQDQVADAVRQSEQHPVPEQPISPRPQPPMPPPNSDPGICYTPGSPGTPDIDIPGTPAVGDSPGTPSIHIPGIPPTPPTSHPCP